MRTRGAARNPRNKGANNRRFKTISRRPCGESPIARPENALTEAKLDARSERSEAELLDELHQNEIALDEMLRALARRVARGEARCSQKLRRELVRVYGDTFEEG